MRAYASMYRDGLNSNLLYEASSPAIRRLRSIYATIFYLPTDEVGRSPGNDKFDVSTREKMTDLIKVQR